VHFAHETAGAARTRHSLRPLFGEAGSYWQSSGVLCREIEKVCFFVIASEAKQSIAPQSKNGLLRR
jgi:hypothetical protein